VSNICCGKPRFEERRECSIKYFTIQIAGSQKKGMTETNVEKTSRKGNEEKWTGKGRCTK